MDLIMLVNSPRKQERTLKEYRDLLAMAGFRLGRIDPRSATPVFRDVAYCVDQAHRTARRTCWSDRLKKCAVGLRRSAVSLAETSCLSLRWAVLDVVIDAAHGLGLTDLERQQLGRRHVTPRKGHTNFHADAWISGRSRQSGQHWRSTTTLRVTQAQGQTSCLSTCWAVLDFSWQEPEDLA